LRSIFPAAQIAHFDEANYGHVSTLAWPHQDVTGSCAPEAEKDVLTVTLQNKLVLNIKFTEKNILKVLK